MTRMQSRRYEAARIADVYDGIQEARQRAIDKAERSAEEKLQALKARCSDELWAQAFGMINSEVSTPDLDGELDTSDFDLSDSFDPTAEQLHEAAEAVL